MCDEQEWLSSFSTFVPLTEKGSGKKTQWCFQQGKQNSWGEVEALILKQIKMEVLENLNCSTAMYEDISVRHGSGTWSEAAYWMIVYPIVHLLGDPSFIPL